MHRALATASGRQLKRVRTAVERNQPAIQTRDMAKKIEPPQPTSWTIHKIAARQIWMGEIEAPDETAAIEKAAEQFKVSATKLMTTRRR